MKLHRLELRGIGPFAGHHTIDFDRLSVAGLYLLEGPTGSGKSTIIDAITWALYGAVAGGDDSTKDRIRSTHADPRTESFVDLVFSVNAGMYRVRRTPDWFKAGNKNPTNSTAKLWKLYDGALEAGDIEAGVILETKPTTVGPAISELVGLTRKQFVQTIVLPQGKFAEFLRLNSADRTELLEQVFGTEIYRKFAENLAGMASTAGKDVEAAKQAFLTSFDYLLEASRVDDSVADDLRSLASAMIDPAHHSDLSEQVDRLHSLAEADAENAKENRLEAEKELQHRQQALTDEKTLADALARRQALLRRQGELENIRTMIGGLQESLDTHRLALLILPRIEAQEKAELVAEAAQAALHEVLAEVPETVGEELVTSAEEELSHLTSVSGALNELEKREQTLGALRTAHQSDTDALHLSRKKLQETEAASSSLPADIAEARSALHEAEQVHAGLATATNSLNDASTQLLRLQELRELHARISTAKAAATLHLAEFRAAKEAHDRVTAAWVASTAANLALTLDTGHPCPVCGSLTHPAPAHKPDAFATYDDVEAAEAVRQDKESVLHESELALESLHATAAALEKETHGVSVEEAQEAVSQAEASVRVANEAELLVAATSAQIVTLEDRYRASTDELTSLREEIVSLESRLSERAKRIAEDEARLAAELNGFDTVSARLIAHRENVAAKKAEIEAIRAYLTARHTHEERVNELSDALAASSFTSSADVRAAVLPEERVKENEERIAQYARDTHDVERDLTSPDIAALTGEEIPQVDHAQAAYDSARERAESAQTASTTLSLVAEQVRQRSVRLRTLLQEWIEARATAGPIVRLAGLANGSSEYSLTKMTLPTYVLSQRFRLVVERANEHLAVFSLGRYELVATEEKEKGSRAQKVGLGLEIVDHVGDAHGDVRRATKSLSGGETFYVSLSLALALADVVCAENGGIQLDTLMIDEGFGTLDEDTRDQVMRVLGSLAKNGRSVAIVSHVEDLKKMIAEQIVVRPLPDGSSTLTVRV